MYHHRSALPTSWLTCENAHNTYSPYPVPQYLYLDLTKHVLQSVAHSCLMFTPSKLSKLLGMTIFLLPVKRKEKTTQAVKTLPASFKEKRIPRAEAPCIPFTKRNKKEVNGDHEDDVQDEQHAVFKCTQTTPGLLSSANAPEVDNSPTSLDMLFSGFISQIRPPKTLSFHKI
eukprot:1147159-Pelagomonas_calceolata.AAC.2